MQYQSQCTGKISKDKISAGPNILHRRFIFGKGKLPVSKEFNGASYDIICIFCIEENKHIKNYC